MSNYDKCDTCGGEFTEVFSITEHHLWVVEQIPMFEKQCETCIHREMCIRLKGFNVILNWEGHYNDSNLSEMMSLCGVKIRKVLSIDSHGSCISVLSERNNEWECGDIRKLLVLTITNQ